MADLAGVLLDIARRRGMAMGDELDTRDLSQPIKLEDRVIQVRTDGN